MRRLTYLFLGIFLLVLILSACGVPTSGPQAWLDWPLDNAIVPIAPLTIQAHASDSDGISRFKFEVDGSSIANVKVDGSRLGEASIEWTPPGPGTYLISVQTVDKSGNPGVVATARVTVTSDPTPTPDALFLAETTTPFAESAETTFAKISHIECGPDQTVYIDISIGNLQGILGYSLYSTWIDASVAEVLTEPLPQLVEKRLQITEPIDTIDRQHQFTLVAEIPETSTLLATNIYEPGGRCPGHYQEEVEMAPSDPIAPLVNATQNANCRRGPSLEYDIVTNLLEGQSAEITGRSTDSSWWVINPGTTCWISGAVVDVSGDITGVAVVSAPPLTVTEEPPPSDTTPPSFYSIGVSPDLILTEGGVCEGYERATVVAAAVAHDGDLSSVVAYWNIGGAESGQVTLQEGGLGHWALIGPVNTVGTMEIYMIAVDTSGNSAQSDTLYVTVNSCIE